MFGNVAVNPFVPTHKKSLYSQKLREPVDSEKPDFDEKALDVQKLRSYYRHIYNYSLLTRAKEHELGQKIKTGREANDIIAFYHSDNQANINEKLAEREEVKQFFAECVPEKIEKIVEMSSINSNNEKIIKFILDKKTPKVFLKDNHNHPLIKKTMEKFDEDHFENTLSHLVKTLKAGASFITLREKVKEYEAEGKITPGEIKQIKKGNIPEKIKKQMNQADNARRLLAEAYARIVPELARQYGFDLEYNDALNIGNLGLMEATRNYDCTKSNGFYNFAKTYVKSYIMNANKENSSLVHIPRHLQSEKSNLNKKMRNSVDSKEQLIKAIRNPVYLSEPVAPDGEDGTTKEELFESEHMNPEQELLKKQSLTRLKQIYDHIIPDENVKHVLNCLFVEDMSQVEIARMMKLTSERISQHQKHFFKDIAVRCKEYQIIQKIPQSKKQALLTKTKNILSEVEFEAVITKLGLFSPDGRELSTHELNQQLKKSTDSKKLLPSAVYKNSMKILENNQITKESLLSCREMPAIGELIEIKQVLSSLPER